MNVKSALSWVTVTSLLLAATAVEAARLNAVQSGSVVLPNGSLSVTDTLSPAVDTTKSFLVFSATGNSNVPASIQVSGQITNGTTITFARIANAGDISIQWYVVEFVTGVSVQRGTTQLPGAANPADINVPITAVDPTKSFPLISFRTDGGTVDGNDFVRAKLVGGGASLDLLAPDGGLTAFVEWQVIEYTDSIVQTGDVALPGGTASQTASLSPSVDPSRSWLVYSHEGGGAGANIGSALVRGVITDGSTLTFDRNNTTSGITLTWYLVEFTDGNWVNHGSEPFSTTETQRDITLTPPVDPSLSIALGGVYMRSGRSSFSADDNPGVGWFTTELTAGNNLRATRGLTGSSTADLGWFVIQFLNLKYRSIGTRGNYGTAEAEGNLTTVTATTGETLVTGAGTSWLSSNRGRGDVIEIEGVPYTILSVDSETQLNLTKPYTGATAAGKSYFITRQFTTIQDWVSCANNSVPCTYDAVVSSSLVSDNRREIGIAYDDSTFQENVLISGATTDDGRYMHLTVAENNRHDGTRGTGATLDPNVDGNAITVQQNDTRIDWLEITGWSGNAAQAVRIDDDSTIYDHMLVYAGPETTHDDSDGFYLQPASGNWTATIRNTIVLDVPRAGIHLQNFSGSSTLVLNVENVTVYNCGTGASPERGGIANRQSVGSSTINAKNVLAVGNGNNDFQSTDSPSWGTSQNNISSDTTAPGGGSLTNRTLTTLASPGTGDWVVFQDLTGGSEDLHLVNAVENDAVQNGTDLSASFTDDIDTDTRVAPWDVGADELLIPPASVTLADHDLGQVPDRFTNTTPVGDVLFRFKLTRTGTATVENVRIGFTTGSGVVNGDVSAGALWIDNDNDGTVSGGDSLIEGAVTPVGGVLTFTSNFSPDTGGTNYLLNVTVSNLTFFDTTTFSLDAAGIDYVEIGVTEPGSITSAVHTQDPPPTLTLANHPAGQTGDKFGSTTPVTDVLFQFALSKTGTVTVDTVRANFTTGGGVSNADVTAGELWQDTNGNGNWDGGPTDTLIQGAVTPVGGVLTFVNDFVPADAGTTYFLRATVANLVDGDTTTFSITTADIDEVQGGVTESGSATNAVHTQDTPAGGCSPTVNYRSIGTNAADLANTGTVTAATGTFSVSFSGVSLPSNVGRGDRLTLDPGGLNEVVYISQRVTADTVVLQTPLSNNYVGASYAIQRAFSGATALQDWEAARQGDLVAQTRREVGVAYNDGVFNERLTIAGSITDSCHYMWLTVAAGQRHSGTAGTGARMRVTTGGASLITVQDEYTRIHWMELDGSVDSGLSGAPAQLFFAFGDASFSEADRLLIYDGDYAGIEIGDFVVDVVIRNSVLYGMNKSAGEVATIQFRGAHNNGDTLTIQNTTVYNSGQGGIYDNVDSGNVVIVAQNTLVVGSANDDFDSTADWTGSSNNLSSDATAPGAGSLTGRAAANQFVDLTSGSEDLHLKSGADALEAGTDLSGSFSVDIDDESRPKGALWDIGADERLVDNTCPTDNPAWYDTRWGARKAIAIQSSLVTGNLTSFPVLLSLASDADLAADAQNNGNDILFTAADGVTKLSHEIEKFDGATGELVAWIKIPYVSSGADTVFWMYFGNGSASDQRDAVNVWDANFEAVWHLVEDPSATQVFDSTGNGNHGTAAGGMTGANQVPGRMAGALRFDGVDDLVNAGPGADNLGPLTASAWVRPDTFTGNAGKIVAKYNAAASAGRWYVELDDSAPEDDTFEFLKGHATTDLQVISSNATASYNAWQYVAVTWDGGSAAGNVHIYKNASELTYQTTTSGAGAMEPDTGQPLIIGNRSDGAQGFLGVIDEVRISNIERPLAWIQTEYNNQFNPTGFCKVCVATTEVDLVSFEARALDGGVELVWETGSEIDNLGFNLYRSGAAEGPYERITNRLIPGLGSSPEGASYRYRDVGLVNGRTYFYELEDVESSGRTTRHGPVSVTPFAGAGGEDDGSEDAEPHGRITFGNPAANGVRLLEAGPRELVLELSTGGFYATAQEDGTVLLEIPGFDETLEEGHPSLPVSHHWIEAIAGRGVDMVAVEGFDTEAFEGLRPSGVEPHVITTRRGTAQGARRRSRLRGEKGGWYPRDEARIISVGFQGDVKKALIEMAPLRWDGDDGRVVLSRRLVVRLSFERPEPADQVRGGRRGRRYRKSDAHEKRDVAARLIVRDAGLYRVRFEDVFPGEPSRSIDPSRLRLSRQGQAVPFHLGPEGDAFGPGATLFFYSDGAEINPYGNEAVYELETGAESVRMPVVSGVPRGEATRYYWKRIEKEENRLYQAAVARASDPWLWSTIFGGARERHTFEVTALAQSPEASRLRVFLQGASDLPADPDHHVRVYVNGSWAGETSWNGEAPRVLEAELAPGVLHEGPNVVEIENVGDTGATWSVVMLNRVELRHPRALATEGGWLEGDWSVSGRAEVGGVGAGAVVLDRSFGETRWLTGLEAGDAQISFRAEAGHSYTVVGQEAIRDVAAVRKPPSSRLKSKLDGVDYLLVGPRLLLDAAVPLATHRQEQGLRVRSVAVEEIFSEFGFGETTPYAIREFLAYAYHRWKAPPRYVLLLGDATYDFKDYLGTGVENQLPPLMVRTSYLFTASDPAYAAVNGEDLLPDLAIGRLPAKNADELTAMVRKILAWETRAVSSKRIVLVTDNPDGAGDFVANAEELASTVLASRDVEQIHLRDLGPVETRGAIRNVFDEGASLVSYIGHGGIHLWASENIFNRLDVADLSPQSEQPLLITMNCLNGYFHFPYFDALAEALLKPEDKGVIAAFSPSGLSLDAEAHRFHEALLAELGSGRHERLGDAVAAAQEAFLANGMLPELLSIYHLLGDPALPLSAAP